MLCPRVVTILFVAFHVDVLCTADVVAIFDVLVLHRADCLPYLLVGAVAGVDPLAHILAGLAIWHFLGFALVTADLPLLNVLRVVKFGVASDVESA